MRLVLSIVLFLSYSLSFFAQNESAFMIGTPTGADQPELHISKVEREGWTEVKDLRKEFSSQYIAADGKKIAYSSVQAVNYQNETGQWQAVDIRPTFQGGNWHAFQQEIPVSVGSDAAFQLTIRDQGLRFSSTLNVNGIGAETALSATLDRQQLVFENIVPGVNKMMEFRQGALKYNYILHTNPTISQEYFEIEEIFTLPMGYSAELNSNADRRPGIDPAISIRNSINEICAAIGDLICFDSDHNYKQGDYSLELIGDNSYKLKLKLEASWLSAADRSFPVTIDPLVVGTTTNFGVFYIPSCFFPDYGSDSVLVEVPGGITVTALNVITNYFASPFTTTIMGDGRMFFSSECDNTVVFQVQGQNGLLPGTAYLELYDMHSPILCCKPPQCEPYSIWLSQHLSRTSNGPFCDNNYLYYDPFSLWPYSVYAEGYTPELYGNELNFSPNSICSNDCDVDGRIFARYGVPPLEFTHPWSNDVIEWGTPVGCSPGSFNRELVINIPDCPIYCDENDVLQVPPPIVTDACGALAIASQPFYELGIDPTPIAYGSVEEITVCNGVPFDIAWESCLDGAIVSWAGNDSSASSIAFTDSIFNTGTSASEIYYISSAVLDECVGLSDTITVTVIPDANVNFSWEPEPAIVNNEIQFTDQTAYNGNNPTGWTWEYLGEEFSTIQNADLNFTEPGTYEICFYPETQYGCSEIICKLVNIIPAELELPNVVTPNNDDVNDILFIKYLEQFSSNKLVVFNRWGGVVYEANNYKNDWSPRELSDGVYYYIVEVGVNQKYSTDLQIKR